MKKTLRIGTMKMHGGQACSIFVRVEYEGGKLSITGVEGPTRDGNAIGGCGQIVMSFEGYGKHPYAKISDIQPAPAWTHAKIKKLFDIWDRWHLNDMRPGCKHQTGPAWTHQDVTVTKWHFSYRAQSELEKEANEETAQSMGIQVNLKDTISLTKAAEHSPACAVLLAARLLGLCEYGGSPVHNWTTARSMYPRLAAYLSAHPDALEEKSEVKSTGWLKESEHPEGFLSKACPVCGYKYGAAWNSEDVPADVIEFLESLPVTDITPAWI